MISDEDIPPGLIETLAAIEHERWSHWQQYIHEKCKPQPDGTLIIPAELVARWKKQSSTPYSALSESEKDSDREQAQKYLPVILAALRRTPDLSELALDTCRHEHDDLLDAWRTLDVKAQGLTAIAGIFLAGIFALVSKPQVAHPPLLCILLVGGVLLLFTSFLGAILCLLVKPSKSAPGGHIAVSFVLGLRDIPDEPERAARTQLFQDDLYRRWESTNRSIFEEIRAKGAYVRDAQISLLFACSLVTVVAVMIILAGSATP
jgi:hypothetical protein